VERKRQKIIIGESQREIFINKENAIQYFKNKSNVSRINYAR